MKMQTIQKAIEIPAPKENVWAVLFQDQFIRIWYAEFMEGAYAETDWQTGSKALFKDNTGNGMVGKVVANRPGEFLSVEYEGLLTNGQEDYTSEGALGFKGGRETYRLSEQGGVTRLAIESDMSEEHAEGMALAWEKALEKIKSLATNLPQPA